MAIKNAPRPYRLPLSFAPGTDGSLCDGRRVVGANARGRWLAAALWVLLASTVHAQEYPLKPVRLIVGFPPGGAVDIVGRALAEGMRDTLGQQVYVDNQPGANGVIGTELIARAVAAPVTRERLAGAGIEPRTDGSPETFGTFLRSDYARWEAIVRKSSVRLE